MVDTAFDVSKTSPLDGMAPPVGGVSLREQPFVGKINIRGNAESGPFASIVEGVLGGALPTGPNTTVSHGKFTVFWLGPDEWMVQTPDDGQGELIERLRAVLGDSHSAVTDVSDYFVVIEMRGNDCRDVLARGCPLDLHPRNFGPGRCAQSHFSHATILLHQVNDTDFDIQVRWTYAQYLWGYLAEAVENRGIAFELYLFVICGN